MNNHTWTWKNAVRRLKEIGKDDSAFVEAGLNQNRQQARDTAADLYVRYHMYANQ